jgi:hypothetical protein
MQAHVVRRAEPADRERLGVVVVVAVRGEAAADFAGLAAELAGGDRVANGAARVALEGGVGWRHYVVTLYFLSPAG